MKPEIIISASDLDRLEALLATPAARNRTDLNRLREELDRADIRDDHEMPDDVIRMNTRARFREHPSGREYELTLSWPGNADNEGQISIFTPAGSALLGLAVGQTIEWPTPDNRDLRLEVLEITFQPEPSED
jgi:regulator of nucleoside diphosphate kinase